MKKTIALFCMSLMIPSVAFAGSKKENLQDRVEAAKTVLDQIMSADDRSIPLNILEQATCVAVVTVGARRSLFAWRADRGACKSAGNRQIWFWWR
jgi:hypothetical protein